MATVCAGSLAMMDAGIASQQKLLPVLQWDWLRKVIDLLFFPIYLEMKIILVIWISKLQERSNGITAFQMDIKIQGISFEIMEKALQQAREGRLHILGIMDQSLGKPREQLSEFAPRLISMKVEQDQIGLVIGPGGKTIQGMQRLFGVEINIEEDGTVNIASPNKENAVKCKEYIKKMTATPEIGEIYEGVITKLMDFGAFVEIIPGKEGLLHISQIDNKRVDKVSDYFKVGDKVTVKAY